MTEQRLDMLYTTVNASINFVKSDIRHAESRLVFDPENDKLKAYIAHKQEKLAELKAERLAILKAE